MSLYNLENRTILNYYIQHKEKILNFSDKEYIFKYFSIGKKVNKKERNMRIKKRKILKLSACCLMDF